MRKYNTIFLDRDGTLNPDPGYISSLDQFEFYDFTIPALQRLAYSGNRFCIVTNQSGVSRGLIDQDDLNKIHVYLWFLGKKGKKLNFGPSGEADKWKLSKITNNVFVKP